MKKLYRFRKDENNNPVIERLVPIANSVNGFNSVPLKYNADEDNLEETEELNLMQATISEELHVLGLTLLDDDVIIGQGLTIKGDLVVDGVSYTTSEESLDTTSDYVVLRQSNTSGLASDEKAGFVVHNYSGNKNAALTVDREGTFRVSDNTQENNTGYSNISSFNNVHYDGLNQSTPITLKHGAIVSQDIDEYEEVVWHETNQKYYKWDSVRWFEVYLDSNSLAIDISNPITDDDLIAELEALDKHALRYARNLTIMSISDTYTETETMETFHFGDYDFDASLNTEDVTGYIVQQTIPFVYPSMSPVTFVTLEGDIYRVNPDATDIYIDKYERVWSVDLDSNTVDVGPYIVDTDIVDNLETLTPEPGYHYYLIKTTTIINNQPILTRAEADDLKDGQLLVWDATSKKAVAFTEPTKKNQTIVSGKNSNDEWTYSWGAGAGSGGAVAHFATRSEWEAAKLIQEGEDGFIPANSLVVIDDETDFLTGVEQGE